MKNKKIARQLASWDKKYVWHPFTQMKDWKDPLIISSGKGVMLKDINGKQYIDGISSLWVNVHGHCVPDIDRAISKQLKAIGHSTLLGLSNIPSIQLAKSLVEISPANLKKVFYSDNGSTACEIALKMAYQYWQQVEKNSKRKYFITFSEAYHGDTIGSVSLGGIELFHKVYRPLLFSVIRMKSPYHAAKKGKVNELLKKIENTLKKREVMGIVMEPLVQGASGMLTHPKGFLRSVRRLCDRYKVLLILDEVATGFGRTGKMFACQHEGVEPDIMAVAKGITGGYLPIAATLVSEKVYKGFLGYYKDLKTFFHGHTYTGNPLGCAAAMANLELFKKKKVIEKLQPKIKFMASELKKFRNLPHVGEIRQCGFMVGIDLVKNKKIHKPYLFEDQMGNKVIHEARKRGALLRPLGNVIVIMPPLSIRLTELRKLLLITYKSIEEVTH